MLETRILYEFVVLVGLWAPCVICFCLISLQEWLQLVGRQHFGWQQQILCSHQFRLQLVVNQSLKADTCSTYQSQPYCACQLALLIRPHNPISTFKNRVQNISYFSYQGMLTKRKNLKRWKRWLWQYPRISEGLALTLQKYNACLMPEETSTTVEPNFLILSLKVAR